MGDRTWACGTCGRTGGSEVAATQCCDDRWRAPVAVPLVGPGTPPPAPRETLTDHWDAPEVEDAAEADLVALADEHPHWWWHSAAQQADSAWLRSSDETYGPGRYEAGNEWKGERAWVSRRPACDDTYVYAVVGEVHARDYPGDPDARQLDANAIVRCFRVVR